MSGENHETIKQDRLGDNARGKKPIIAYASGSCCSGAYWIVSACDKIMAADTAILGSIGVVFIFITS